MSMDKMSTASSKSSFVLQDPKLALHKPGLEDTESLRSTSIGVANIHQNRFRLVAVVAHAVKRWQSMLNPVYTYGHKRDEDGIEKPAMLRLVAARKTLSEQPKAASASLASGRVNTLSGRTTSTRTISGRPMGAKSLGHGNKTNILFGRVPAMQACEV